jgi:hypothetical protein
MGSGVKAFLNLTPHAAKASRFGVLIILLPAQPRQSQRIWSAVINRIFFIVFFLCNNYIAFL